MTSAPAPPERYYTIDSLVRYLETLPNSVLLPFSLRTDNINFDFYVFDPNSESQQIHKRSTTPLHDYGGYAIWNVLDFRKVCTGGYAQYVNTVGEVLKFLRDLQSRRHGHKVVSYCQVLFTLETPKIIVEPTGNGFLYHQTSINMNHALKKLIAELNEKKAKPEEIESILRHTAIDRHELIYIADSNHWISRSDFLQQFPGLKEHAEDMPKLFIQTSDTRPFQQTLPEVTIEGLSQNFGKRASVQAYIDQLLPTPPTPEK